MSQEHGQKTKLGRWCATCGHEHGPLYACEHYPEDVRAEIEQRQRSWTSTLRTVGLKTADFPVPFGVRCLNLALQCAWAGIEEIEP